MTKQKLDEHLHLLQELQEAREVLESLEAASLPKGSRLDGMPHTPGPGDPVGRLAAEIADMRATVNQIANEVSISQRPIEEYINTITDSYTRMIFRLRYIHGMAWKEVAGTVGGRNTQEGVKAVCYRYMARGAAARMGRPRKDHRVAMEQQANTR